MDNETQISVVLPVFYVNRDWLRQSIESVLDQDYANKELIVVNDAATEDIDALVKSYGIRKYIKNDRNRQLPYSLNRGFEVAEGEFHTWTSADNYMLPGMLSRMARALQEQRDAGIVFHKYRIVNENGQDIDVEKEYEHLDRLVMHDRHDLAVPRRYCFVSTLGACFLYRREVWEETKGYEESLHGAEDFDFWLRASRHFRIVRLPWSEPALYVYRLHGNSISSTVSGAFAEKRLRVLAAEAQLFPKDPCLRKAIRRVRGAIRGERIHRFKRAVRQTLMHVLSLRDPPESQGKRGGCGPVRVR